MNSFIVDWEINFLLCYPSKTFRSHIIIFLHEYLELLTYIYQSNTRKHRVRWCVVSRPAPSNAEEIRSPFIYSGTLFWKWTWTVEFEAHQSGIWEAIVSNKDDTWPVCCNRDCCYCCYGYLCLKSEPRKHLGPPDDGISTLFAQVFSAVIPCVQKPNHARIIYVSVKRKSEFLAVAGRQLQFSAAPI